MLAFRRWAYSNGSYVMIAGLGMAFLASYLIYVTTQRTYLEAPVWLFLLGLVLMVVLSLGLVYSGYWLKGSDFDSDQNWRITIWMLASLLGVVAMTFWPVFYQRIVGVAIEDPGLIVVVSAGLGANAGIIAGIAQIRSEREFEQVQDAHDSLAFINRTLRHNVLNALQIVQSNANILIEQSRSEATEARARTIRRQNDRIRDLIENVRVLVKMIEGEVRHEAVDLSAIVENELETAREIYDHASIESDLSPGVCVRADPLVSTVVDSIITNAITHNDQNVPRVDVTLEVRGSSAVLAVADNGPGIPDKRKETVTDAGPHGDHGLGLYLADMMVTRYDGEIHLDDNEPRGTVARVELPLTDDDETR